MEEVVSNDASTAHQRLKLVLERKLANVESLATPRCMYKVPQKLHDANKEAYTPKVISIGPYHCRSKNLLSMHSLKTSYLQTFLKRTKLELDTFIEMAQGWEENVRGYYDDECGLNSDEFVEMILMDGIFIVEFTWQCYNEGLFRQSSLRDDIMGDLMLLENQLPFFVPEGLAGHPFPDNKRRWILYLTTLFIDHFDLITTPDLTRLSWVDPNRSLLTLVDSSETSGILHLVDFIHGIIRKPISSTSVIRIPSSSTSVRGPRLELSPTATQLQEAGVNLGCATDLILTHIVFNEEDGLLQIPRLVVNRHTESLFRNIIAYEQCYLKGSKFRSYVILMDYLINTSKDVELLVHSGIIQNSLGESQDVCTLFNNLYKMPMMDSSEFRFAYLCKRLNKYSRDPWQKWKARCFRWKLTLRSDYFSSPWSIVSVIAAFMLLGLTTIQTICSIKGVKW